MRSFTTFYLIEIWNAVVLVLSTYIFFGTVHFHHAVVAADYYVGYVIRIITHTAQLDGPVG